MRPTVRHALLLATAALAACGGVAAPILNASRPHGTALTSGGHVAVLPAHLIVQHGTPPGAGIAVLDTLRQRSTLSFPVGVLAPSGTRLYAVTRTPAGGTVLQAIDTRTGSALTSAAVPGRFALPLLGPEGRPVGLSPDGRHLVLSDENPSSGAPRTTSHLLIYDTTALAQKPVLVQLSGDFLFDGISNDARNLYLLENLGATGTGDPLYNVRRYDLGSARLDPRVVADKRTGERSMSGMPIDSVTSRDGAWQYTVYGLGARGPFVHALNLVSGIAACIDLPGRAGEPELDLLWAVVAGHDGRHVYAVNAAAGAAVEMSSTRPWETRTANLSAASAGPAAAILPWDIVAVEAKRIAFGAAAISPDDSTVYALGVERISVIDTAALRVRDVVGPQRALASLALSGNGRTLYAVTFDDRPALLQVDTIGGTWTTIAGVDAPLSVLQVAP